MLYKYQTSDPKEFEIFANAQKMRTALLKIKDNLDYLRQFQDIGPNGKPMLNRIKEHFEIVTKGIDLKDEL
jgi:hypothetical protein